MSEFTITTSIETGKVDPEWGNEYIIKIAESSDSFKINSKTKPEDGSKIYGTIEQGKWGPWFKRGKNPNAKPYVNTKDSRGNEAPRSFGAQQADKSDGMRQGMCMNNAAAYVAAISEGKDLNPRQWSDAVYAYACALYSKGDLKVVEASPISDADLNAAGISDDEIQGINEAPSNVKALFS